MDISEEKQFLDNLLLTTLPLENAIRDKFSDKMFPLEYATGLVIGAGLTHCKCGRWGYTDDLERDGVQLPCHHLEPRTV